MDRDTVSIHRRNPSNTWEYYNRGAISEEPRAAYLGVAVKTRLATYHGKPYKQLTSWERRKWENMLVIAYASTGTPIRIAYH